MRFYKLTAAFALVFTSTGCLRPPDPAAMLSGQADPATLDLIEQAGDRTSLVVVLRPGRWKELASTMRPLLGETLPAWIDRALKAPDALAAVDAALRDTPFRPGGIEGLDLNRPIVAGLFEPRLNDLVLAARAVVPGPPGLLAQGVEGVRHRVLLPATSTEALKNSLVQLAARLGLEPAIEDTDAGRVVYALPNARGFVALAPGRGNKPFLRVEILTDEGIPYRDQQHRDAAWMAMLDKPTGRGEAPLTPAFAFTASRRDLLVVWLRPWPLRDLTSQMGTRMLVEALRHADPAYKQMLLAKGLSIVASSYLLMTPAGAEIDDMAMALDLDRGLRLTACMSLTASGARIVQAGLERDHAPLKPKQEPYLFTFWSRLDAAAMLAAASTPPVLAGAKKLSDLSYTITECGPLCMLHLGARTPFGLLKTVIELAEQDLTGLPPGAVSIALKDLRPSPIERPLQLAAAATYRQASGVRQVRRALAELEKNIGDKPRVQLFVEPQEQAQVVKLGIGIDPRDVFGTEAIAAPGDVIAATTVDLGMIANLVARESPEAAALLDRLDDLRGQSRLAGRALVGEMLVGLKGSKPLAYDAIGDYRRFDWQTPGAAQAGTRGAGCMRQVTRGMIEGFGALAPVSPEQRGLMMARLIQEMEAPLACAIGEPDTRDRARKTRRLLALYVANLLLDDFHQEQALQVLDRACGQGHEQVCRKAREVRALPAVELASIEATCPLDHTGGMTVLRVPNHERSAALPGYRNALASGEPPLLAVDKTVRFERLAEVIGLLAPGHTEAGLLVRGGYGSPGVIRVGLPATDEAHTGDGTQPDERPDRSGESARRERLEHEAGEGKDLLAVLAGSGEGSAGLAPSKKELVIHLDGATGHMFANGTGMCFVTGDTQPTSEDCESLEELAEETARLRDDFPGGYRVYLDAGPDVAFARVVRVIAAVLCDRTKNAYMQEYGTRLILGPVPEDIMKRAKTPPPGGMEHVSTVGIGGKTEGILGLGGIGVLGKRAPPGNKRTPRIHPGKTMVRGALDKNVIRRVIRKSQNQVRFCYERELVKDPELAGRITVKFVISAKGTVVNTEIASTTMKNEAVERCLERVVQRMRFPAPRGGGIVMVNYPFIFRTR